MSESYKILKEKALEIYSFSNIRLSLGIALGVNFMFSLIVIFKISTIFALSVLLMAVSMGAVFYGLYKQAFPSEETPEAPIQESEEIDAGSVQRACSVLYDMLNDAVQALRNIIVLKDPQTVVCVLIALSILALLSQWLGDCIVLWILLDLPFLFFCKLIDEGGFVGSIINKINPKEYINMLLGMIPRYQDKEESTVEEKSEY